MIQDNYPPMPPPKPKRRTGLIVGLVAGVIVLLCLCGGIAASFVGGDSVKPETTTSDGETTKAEEPVTTESPASPKPTKPAVPTIEDGYWVVGEDVPPGTYKVTAAASDDCYWAIYKSDTNGDEIIDNYLGGGRPKVTLKKGQDFETARCGTWKKVG